MSQSDNQSVSTIKPGRETDAAVARALGWELRRIGRGVPPGCEGMKHPVAYPRYSTVEADAIEALEATGKDYTIVKDGDRYGCCIWRSAEHAAEGDEFNYAPTLRLAASAAILAWAAAKARADGDAGEGRGK